MRLHIPIPSVRLCLGACPVRAAQAGNSQANGSSAWERQSATTQCYLESCHRVTAWL